MNSKEVDMREMRLSLSPTMITAGQRNHSLGRKNYSLWLNSVTGEIQLLVKDDHNLMINFY